KNILQRMINKKLVVKHYGMVILFSSLSYISFGQINPLVISSTVNNNAGAVKKADPKGGFKNLFESSGNSSAKTATLKGVSMEHLNPQALSFVQDYMEKHADDLKELQAWG